MKYIVKNRNVAIVKDYALHGIWNVESSTVLFEKFKLMCKEIYQTPRWGDTGVVMKRRIDPDWVILRNNAKQRRLLLIDTDSAPANFLEVIRNLYGLGLT
jgi:hypothetical protein